MQFFQDLDGTRTPLPKKNIDTGFGLERIALIVQGKESVFDTDLFRPIIDKFASLAGVIYGRNPRADASLRVIADHGRALVFLAADGVLPSNEGRGYIFRRVLRRAVRHGKLLGLDKPFLAEAADTVIDLLKDHYTELGLRRDRIVEILGFEEKKFGQTLSAGLSLLNNLLEHGLSKEDEKKYGVFGDVIPGEVAFKLYDTHGFPLELTQEVASEHGFTVGIPAFEKAMERQQERSRSTNVFVQGQDDQALDTILKRSGPTEFTGYQGVNGSGKVVGLVVDGQEVETITAPQSALVILDSTPFYAESGGQIGDRGEIESQLGMFEVQDTRKPIKGLVVHYGKINAGYLRVGDTVQCDVLSQRREDTMRNHSATHLLHKALRDMLGTSVEQRGSLVEPERLRFDFTCPRPLTSAELARLDDQINRWVRHNYAVTTRIMPLKEAQATGAMALFGEKYDENVRVVSMGESIELCGGTHCAYTGQIGLYITVQETSVAAGIRRIEALTGHGAEAYLRQRSAAVERVSGKLQTQPDLLENRVDQLLQDLAAARRQIAQFQREKAQEQTATLATQAHEVAGVPVVAATVNVHDDKVIREMGDMVLNKIGRPGVVVLAGLLDERVSLQVSVSSELTRRGLHAGKIAGAVGQKLGGKGGGRPESAQGGGKDKDQLGAALDLVTKFVKENVQ
jgi:alanyl-tRNA synthetase